MPESVIWPRRLWRNVYWWREDRRIRAKYHGVRQLVYFGGDGIGDELLLSVPLRELRRRGATGLCVATSRPEFFEYSDDVDSVRPVAHEDVPFLLRVGVRVTQATYVQRQLPPDIDVPPSVHIIGEMCRRCGVKGEIDLRPWLSLTPTEQSAAARWAACIAVQASRKSASLSIGNKEWGFERFQAVVDVLRSSHRIVQIGSPSDPLLRGADDFRGQTARASAALLAQARAFLGLVGFPMHLARAVDCPAVIVYGGRERPDQSGYICNENLFTALPCSPCWRWNSCDYDHHCMTEIQPPMVVGAMERLLSRPRGPLAVQRIVLS